MSFIWSTRGHDWGFRFLNSGGEAEPLDLYEAVFESIGNEDSVCAHVGGVTGLRFPDPLGRTDHAGRVVTHEFVLRGELTERVNTVEDGLAEVWPLVADEYAAVWDSLTPPD